MRPRILFASLALTVLCISCGSGDRDIRTLKIAHGLNIDHPVHKAMVYLAQQAAEKSDHTLKIDIYPSEQLGTEKECIEQLQMGILSMTKVSSSPLESFVPKIKVFALPFLFRDAEHKWTVLNGPIGKELLVACTPKGFRGLCYYDAGARSFYTVDKPILHPDDLQGLKIRTQQSPMAIDMVNALGGSATPIPWGELYTALQQGVVDGAENNEPSLYTSRHYEVAKHYSLNEHTMVPDVLLISTLQWESLSKQHQDILEQAADESVAYQRILWAEFVQEAMADMTSKGLQVYNPDKTPFMQRAQAMYEKYKGTEIGELAQRIQEVQ
ncbi:TRAP transporter substrate-binding protein [candidate division KSB1 bacterium]|nr:TRAP transporter substrate-binding protein [candidate division KSB1 bacterium]RQW03093.1 MAG: TRAP transporter substrate-binding protein [candidate division KSB1 bacterium]